MTDTQVDPGSAVSPGADPGRTIVIVGASLAGARAAETLRAEGFAGRIVLIGREDELPYERPPLTKAVLAGADDPAVAYLHPAEWYPDNNIELLLGVSATAIDRDAQQVRLDDGSTVAYDQLLLATGAEPRRLDIPGGDLDGIHYVRTMSDSLALRDALTADARVVIVGAGWIGLEAASAARAHGSDVTVLDPLTAPLLAVVGPQLGEIFAKLHRDHGVQLRPGTGVTAFTGDGTVDGVVTSEGDTVRADVVVVGVGAIPAVELAEDAGLEIDPANHGIVTDAHFRTSDPRIFAVGDVASSQRPLVGSHVRIEHWANAYDGGPGVARAMLGEPEPYDAMPFFYSDQHDLGLEYAGYVPRGADTHVVTRGDLDAREFLAFWLDPDDRLLAGMNVNVWDVQDDIQALVRSHRPLDAAKLADPAVPLLETYA